MCELFAMSANQPMDIDRYLARLMPRGGRTRTLLATAPLTNENWRALAPGSIRVYKQGVETGASMNA